MSGPHRIGIFVTDVGCSPGFEDVVSGHVQLPMHTIKLLQEAGHIVHLITNRIIEGSVPPNCLPEGVPIHQVTEPRVRGGDYIMHVGPRRGFHILRLVRLVMQLRRIIKEEQYDIVHFFGANRLAHLAGFMALLDRNVPLVFTFNVGRFPERFWVLTRHLWKRISLVITSTEFIKNNCREYGIEARVLRHGIVRDLALKDRSEAHRRKRRVLFWRDPSVENGADVCVRIFEELAPRYPEISFDFAIRPHWDRVTGIDRLAQNYDNVHVYEFPYENGISLPQLLDESICVLLPFRELSINPQFAILETMFAGKPAVTTTIESNSELIESGRNGVLVPVGDVNATVQAVEELLTDPQKALSIGKRAAEDIRLSWSWDNYATRLIVEYEKLIQLR